MTSLAAISIDLDEIGCYCAIHGLDVPRDMRGHAIYDRALPRLLDFLDERGMRATLFVVALDLARPTVVSTLRDARARGHEIASHSLSHRYDLTRLDRRAIESEIKEATKRIADAIGVRPVGFRAPGYTVVDAVFEILEDDEYVYDSSVFPCPAYYAAKATAIRIHAIRGRTSRSLVDDPRVLLAPRDPYRVGRPYWTRGNGIVELPIGVTSDATMRMPFIGTSVVLARPALARWLARATESRPLVDFELHGIDLADARADDLSFLAPFQPDLRRTMVEKRTSLAAAVDELRRVGKRFVTLADAANDVR